MSIEGPGSERKSDAKDHGARAHPFHAEKPRQGRPLDVDMLCRAFGLPPPSREPAKPTTAAGVEEGGVKSADGT